MGTAGLVMPAYWQGAPRAGYPMTIISAYRYSGGIRAEEITLDSPPSAIDSPDFVWIGLFKPTETELQALQVSYGLASPVDRACAQGP